MNKAVAAVLATGFFVSGLAWAQEDKPMQPMTEQPVKPADKPAAPITPSPEGQPTGKQTEDLPSAESLFDKHLAAIGGMEALKAERNRLVRAKFTGPNSVQGTLRVIRVAPDKLFQMLEIPGQVTQELWCDGVNAWVRDTNKGTRRVEGVELAEYRRQADMLGECNYKIRYREIRTVSRETFAGVDAFAIQATPAEGKERVLYFSSSSGLLIGIRTPGEFGPASDSVAHLSDYKKFGDVLHPTKTVMKSGEAELGTLSIIQVEVNLAALPSVNPPDEVRAVK